MGSYEPGHFARFIGSFELEENGSVLRDAAEYVANGFADLAHNIRLISGRIDEVTQVELRAQMNAQFLFVCSQLEFVRVPARLEGPGAIFWPGDLKSHGRLHSTTPSFRRRFAFRLPGTIGYGRVSVKA